MKKLVIGTSFFVSTLFAVNAQALEFNKPITTTVAITKPNPLLNAGVTRKQVTLMNVNLTKDQRDAIMNYQPKKTETSSKFPSSINLGMNGVPVLDQGQHGTCVTFSNTAAIDAILGKGDYISQLCSLELGTTLEKQGYYPSGWDGSFGPWILDQMFRFGYVTMDTQRSQSCAGVKEYPTNDQNKTGRPISLEAYKKLSSPLAESVYAVQILNFIERMENKDSDPDTQDYALDKVKENLVKGNRLTFGVNLVLPETCNVGACATYKAKLDTWALTKELDDPNNEIGGHEMVIIGYDDNAVAVDKAGNQHKGLLILRNSWGSDVGDNGNFYMTYDYFKKYTDEVQAIVKEKESPAA